LQAAVIRAAVGDHAVWIVDARVVVDRPYYNLVEVLLEYRTQATDGELAAAVRMDGERQRVREQVLRQRRLGKM
jgi:hypothetical protein